MRCSGKIPEPRLLKAQDSRRRAGQSLPERCLERGKRSRLKCDGQVAESSEGRPRLLSSRRLTSAFSLQPLAVQAFRWVIAALGVWLLAPSAHAATANRIVAVINDDIITQGDINVRLSGLIQEAGAEHLGAGQAEMMRQAVVQRLLQERLILQEAKRLKLTIDPKEVTDRMKMVRERLGSKEAFDAMLVQTGLNEEQLKMKLREQLLVQKAIDEQVRRKIVITPAELTEASTVPPPSTQNEEEVDAYHIMIRVTDQRPAAEAEQLINQLHEQLLAGADFSELAKQHSEGPHAEDGGHLGWLRPGELMPELDDVLFKLQPGEVSGPLQTRLGFHLLKVAARRGAQQAHLSDADQAEARLYQQKFAKAMQKWLESLRQKAYIQVMTD